MEEHSIDWRGAADLLQQEILQLDEQKRVKLAAEHKRAPKKGMTVATYIGIKILGRQL